MVDRKRVDALLAAALELAPEAREPFLERECETQELRTLLARLLAASERSTDGPLGEALWREMSGATPELAAGAHLGAYRIVHQLGQGGMALVYLAERADGQYQHRVALKILERAAGDAEAVARFERERQILASLEHPGIARLLDGGLAPDGRPWFAMEYVEGRPINLYCDGEQLDVRARLRLFAEVGKAVAAAHRQLVVHRDIKPSNILVSREGVPKLLDFGIAKLLEGGTSDREETELTGTHVPMTPRYASPEQIAGGSVTTASDVYQLGLLLYELVCGQWAFEHASPRPSEGHPHPSAREVTRPSAAVFDQDSAERARRRGCASPRQLRRLLMGDLDTIVLAALRPQAERRYESASRMVEDVERYLAGRPILARPDAFLYRARKFVGRNRFAVAASAAGLSVALGLSAFYTVRLRTERSAAEAEAKKAQQVSQFLLDLFKATDPFTAKMVANRTALELLKDGAAKLEAGKDAALEGQPVIKAAMLHAIAKVFRMLGTVEDAERLLNQAAELRSRHLGAEHPDTLESQMDLAALLEIRGRFEESLALHREVLAARERRLGPEAGDVARSLREVAQILQHLSRHQESRAAAERALEIYRRQQNPAPSQVSQTHLVLARCLSSLDDAAAALEHYDRAIEVVRGLADPSHPALPAYLAESTVSLNNLGRVDEARARFREALELAEDNPRVIPANLAILRISAARAEIGAENYAGALSMVDQSLPILERDLGPTYFWIGIGHYRRQEALLGLGRYEEGLAAAAKARGMLAASFGETSVDVLYCDQVRAQLLAHAGRRGEGIALLESQLALGPQVMPEQSSPRFLALFHLAKLEAEEGTAAAEETTRRALDLVAHLQKEGSAATVELELLYGRLLLARGDSSGAEAASTRAADLLARVQGVSPSLRQQAAELAAKVGRRGRDG